MIALFNSCEPEETCRSNIYKDSFVDDLIIISNTDTTNILVEQLHFYNYSPDTILYSVREDGSSDLIKLNLFVSYESYSETPYINKDAIFNQDTVFVWYSIIDIYNNSLMKNNSVLEVQCSPPPERSRIDSIHVEIGKDKVVKIESKYLRFY